MAEYPLESGKLALIWGQICQDDVRFLRALVYRPDGSLLHTLDLTDEGNGYHEDRSTTFNGDDFWRVEIEVYTDAARTTRDDAYQTKTDYLWLKDVSGSSGAGSVGGAIDLEIINTQLVALEAQNTMNIDLLQQDQDDVNLELDEKDDVSLEIEEKPSIELELECQE